MPNLGFSSAVLPHGIFWWAFLFMEFTFRSNTCRPKSELFGITNINNCVSCSETDILYQVTSVWINPWTNLKRAAYSHVWGSNARGIMVRRILWLWQVKGSSLYAPHWRCVPSNPPNSLSDELDVHSFNWFCALYSLYSFSSEVDDDLQPFSRRVVVVQIKPVSKFRSTLPRNAGCKTD